MIEPGFQQALEPAGQKRASRTESLRRLSRKWATTLLPSLTPRRQRSGDQWEPPGYPVHIWDSTERHQETSRGTSTSSHSHVSPDVWRSDVTFRRFKTIVWMKKQVPVDVSSTTFMSVRQSFWLKTTKARWLIWRVVDLKRVNMNEQPAAYERKHLPACSEAPRLLKCGMINNPALQQSRWNVQAVNQNHIKEAKEWKCWRRKQWIHTPPTHTHNCVQVRFNQGPI